MQRDSRSSESALDQRHSLLLTADLLQQFGLTCKHLFYFERSATGQVLTGNLIMLTKSARDPAGAQTGSVVQEAG